MQISMQMDNYHGLKNNYEDIIYNVSIVIYVPHTLKFVELFRMSGADDVSLTWLFNFRKSF